jgi:heterodisulfide reductase subunit A-like polyferredoxin
MDIPESVAQASSAAACAAEVVAPQPMRSGALAAKN